MIKGCQFLVLLTPKQKEEVEMPTAKKAAPKKKAAPAKKTTKKAATKKSGCCR